MSTEQTLEKHLKETHELESFLHEFIHAVTSRHPKPGEDVTRYADELELTIPEVLRGAPIIWGAAEGAQKSGLQTIVLLGPGNHEAIGLTIGCIHIRSIQICLECGWFYCRIVIKGTF